MADVSSGRRVEEILAAQPPQEPSTIQKIANYLVTDSIPAQAVKSAYSGLTSVGDAYAGKIAPDEMLPRAMDAAGMLTLGAGAIPAEANTLRQGITAYHGSPHSFDQFSMGKIGTGEGAQAYGHGLYFAENEGVAKGYRDALAQPYSAQTPEGLARLMTPNGVSPEDAIANIENRLQGSRISPSDRPIYEQAAEYLRNGGDLSPPGHMYEVNINADPAHFLDYDLPISQQSDYVKNALNQAGYDTTRPVMTTKEPTGGTVVQSWDPLNRAAVTTDFSQAGIPGIKYLDAGSRTQLQQEDLLKAVADYDRQIGNAQKTVAALPENMRGEYQGEIDRLTRERAAVQRKTQPTRNYVVFDDNLVNIVKKYGIAGALGAGLISATQAAQMQGDPNMKFLDSIVQGNAT